MLCSVCNVQDAATVFTAGQVEMQSAGASDTLNTQQRIAAHAAFQQCASSPKQVVDRKGNYYVDPRAGVSHAQLNLMLEGSLHCKTTDDIRRMRLHT